MKNPTDPTKKQAVRSVVALRVSGTDRVRPSLRRSAPPLEGRFSRRVGGGCGGREKSLSEK